MFQKRTEQWNRLSVEAYLDEKVVALIEAIFKVAGFLL